MLHPAAVLSKFSFLFFCIKCFSMRKQPHFGHTFKKQPIFFNFQMYGCFMDINEQKHHHKTTQKQKYGCFTNKIKCKRHLKTTQKQKCGCFVIISCINQRKNNTKSWHFEISSQFLWMLKKVVVFSTCFQKNFVLQNPMMFSAAVSQVKFLLFFGQEKFYFCFTPTI